MNLRHNENIVEAPSHTTIRALTNDYYIEAAVIKTLVVLLITYQHNWELQLTSTE